MPQPTEIKLRTQSRILDVRFDDGSHFELPFEYLRVFSPSAEVTGHGGGEGVLQTGKQNVGITGVEPVGNYALRLLFDDGHNTGLYTWTLLHDLGRNFRRNWARYLERCAEAEKDRPRSPLGAIPRAVRRLKSATMQAIIEGRHGQFRPQGRFRIREGRLGRKGGARPLGIRVGGGQIRCHERSSVVRRASSVEALHPLVDRA